MYSDCERASQPRLSSKDPGVFFPECPLHDASDRPAQNGVSPICPLLVIASLLYPILSWPARQGFIWDIQEKIPLGPYKRLITE